MVLRVAVQNGHNDIKQALSNSGYEVVSMEEDDGPFDAVVYTGVSNDLSGFDSIDYFGDGATMGVNNPSGMILINAQGFSPDQVVSLVNSKFS